MNNLVSWIQAVAATIGGPGLFIIAFLDSSFLSLPQVNDLLVITMIIQHPERMPYYVVMATLGSVAGCLVLYLLARKGGEALVRRRASGPRTARITLLIQRYGVLALIIPALLPPPAPFKLFVLLAGVGGVRPAPFVLAVLAGRGLRYVAIGLLTVWYGRQAIAFLEAHGREVALYLGGAVLVGGLAWVLWRQLRRRGEALTSP